MKKVFKALRNTLIVVGVLAALYLGLCRLNLDDEHTFGEEIPKHSDYIVLEHYGHKHECFVTQDQDEIRKVIHLVGPLTDTHFHDSDYSMYFIGGGHNKCWMEIEPSYSRIIRNLMDNNHKRFYRSFEVDHRTDFAEMKRSLEQQGYLVYSPSYDLSYNHPSIWLSYEFLGRRWESNEEVPLGKIEGDNKIEAVIQKLNQSSSIYDVHEPYVLVDDNSHSLNSTREIAIFLKDDMPSAQLKDIKDFWTKHTTAGKVEYHVRKTYSVVVISKQPFEAKDICTKYKAVKDKK